MNKINLSEKFSRFNTHWDPKIVGELNNQLVKLVKFKGAFTWHTHYNEDELFLVVQGSFVMQFRDHSVVIDEGEFIIVPRGVEHCPKAEKEVHVLLFEPETTINTGDQLSERTVIKPEHI